MNTHSHSRVTTIVLNWNGYDDTVASVQSLLRSSHPTDVIIVDNGSSHAEGTRLRSHFGATVTVLETDRNLGYAGGNNVGLRHVLDRHDIPYVMILNNDCTLDSSVIGELVEHLDRNEIVACAGPDIHLADQPAKPQIRRYGRLKTVTDIETLSGACLLLRTEALRRTGLFDETFFLYQEDRDLTLRLRANGYQTVYVPTQGKAYHHHARSTQTLTGSRYYYPTRNRFLVLKRHYTFLGGARRLMTEFFMDVIRALVRDRNIGAFRHFLRGIRDGIRLYRENPRPRY